MMRIDAAVKRETFYITASVLIFSVLMQAVFLIVGFWDVTVLFGNLYGAFLAVFNFFLLGLTVQKAVTKEEKEAKNLIKLSQTGRMLGLLVLAIVGVYLPCFHFLAVLLPLLFPRIAIMFRPLFDKKTSGEKEGENV
ncbi:MAG: ATP synthase subunit I [Clostridia bacterium]|nr:ATP synthase subunit I [Clostridia bacterium]